MVILSGDKAWPLLLAWPSPSLQPHYQPSSLTTGADAWIYLSWIRSAFGCANGQASADFSSALTEEISPGKVQNLSPRAARLYLMRLDDLWASLFVASLPPAPGLTAVSCSCGREFATRFFRLPLAVTPCVSLRLPSSAPIGSFHPTRFCPCWAHDTRRQPRLFSAKKTRLVAACPLKPGMLRPVLQIQSALQGETGYRGS